MLVGGGWWVGRLRRRQDAKSEKGTRVSRAGTRVQTPVYRALEKKRGAQDNNILRWRWMMIGRATVSFWPVGFGVDAESRMLWVTKSKAG